MLNVRIVDNISKYVPNLPSALRFLEMDVKDWETSRGTSIDDVIALGDGEGVSSIDEGGACSEEDIIVILVSDKDWVTPVFTVVTLFAAGSSMVDDIILVTKLFSMYSLGNERRNEMRVFTFLLHEHDLRKKFEIDFIELISSFGNLDFVLIFWNCYVRFGAII